MGQRIQEEGQDIINSFWDLQAPVHLKTTIDQSD